MGEEAGKVEGTTGVVKPEDKDKAAFLYFDTHSSPADAVVPALKLRWSAPKQPAPVAPKPKRTKRKLPPIKKDVEAAEAQSRTCGRKLAIPRARSAPAAGSLDRARSARALRERSSCHCRRCRAASLRTAVPTISELPKKRFLIPMGRKVLGALPREARGARSHVRRGGGYPTRTSR
jgi:hypothetical protein